MGLKTDFWKVKMLITSAILTHFYGSNAKHFYKQQPFSRFEVSESRITHAQITEKKLQVSLLKFRNLVKFFETRKTVFLTFFSRQIFRN